MALLENCGMVPRYMGNLSTCDPLYDYLRDEMLPQLLAPGDFRPSRLGYQPDFRVYRLAGSHEVYLYAEEHSNLHLIGKFFGSHTSGGNIPYGARSEFNRMRKLRRYGFVDHIPRPLGYNTALNDVLIEEYCEGVTLTCLLSDAIASGQYERLLHALSALASFLSALHDRTTGGGRPIAFQEDCDYLERVVNQLVTGHHLSFADAAEFTWLRVRWRAQQTMWVDHRVLVHGDATPGNFLFRESSRMTALDLERTRCADRVLDLGRVAGEITHFFLRASGDSHAAHPFIGHFLHAYCEALPDGDVVIRSVSDRLPFHVGATLLRIARNSWVSKEHRQMLVEEAKLALRKYVPGG